MNCDKVKQLIPDYIEDNLSERQMDDVSMHINRCLGCRKQFEADKKIWEGLSLWSGIKPEPGYMSRFWRKLSLSETWYESLFRKIKYIFSIPYPAKLVSISLAAVIIIIIGIGSLYNYQYGASKNIIISQLSKEDIDMLEHIDLAEDYDLIAHLDVLEDMDILEKVDFSDV